MWSRGFRPKRKMQIPDLPFRCRENEPQALPVCDSDSDSISGSPNAHVPACTTNLAQGKTGSLVRR
jgi:hypothetical protein